MTQDELKQRVAAAAIHYVMQAPAGSVIGVGRVLRNRSTAVADTVPVRASTVAV